MTDNTPDSSGGQPEEPRQQPEQQDSHTPGDGTSTSGEAASSAAQQASPGSDQAPQEAWSHGVTQHYPEQSTQQHPASGAQQYPTGVEQPTQGTAGYPGYGQPGGQYPYHTQPYPQGQMWQQPPSSGYGPPMGAVQATHEPREPGVRKSLVVGIAVLTLVVGFLSGGLGGYFGSQLGNSGSTSSPTSLDESKPARSTGDAPQGSVQQVADKVLPSVVQLQVETAQGSGEGSGIVLSQDGYILTNSHVAEGAKQGRMTALFHDNRTASVEIVGNDPNSDLAVMKADISGLKPADLGRSDDLPVGASVVAIGSPFGLSGTVTTGIISAKDRPVRAGGEQGSQASVLNALQTDAAINPGNSGGPLVDMDGRVVGINSAIYSPSTGGQQAGSVGLGFAIPIDQARRIAEELKTTGSATQTQLGVRITVGDRPGALVDQVEPGSPAEKAGLRAGEVITKLNDRAIRDPDALVAAVRSHSPGDKVKVSVAAPRGDNERTVEVTLSGKK